MKSLATLRKNKKGFTLVEVIVVLVILAILAAILVPSLTGYINKANERAVIAETRSVVLAAQTIASENYAFNKGWTDATDTAATATLAEVPAANIVSITVSDGKVTEVKYTNYGKTCTYTKTGTTAGAYSVAAAAANEG